ncbi:MAG: fumarylacetoacetate hydrolase family protein [Ignavibacteria bacterium]|nr:fumarylacetoacetate hydrolase family protein [Ignavibacteria bacterium]
MRKFLQFTDGKTLEVANIYGVASNYRLHAQEMGSKIPEDPVIFLKPTSAFVPNGGIILLPDISQKVHYEVELVVVIGEDGFNIPEKEAINFIAGYAVGIDVTLRDLQTKAKQEGKPWDIAKGFYTSAPISPVLPAEMFKGTIPNFDLVLKVNNEIRQKANTEQMERKVETLVSFISNVFSLNRGDCIFTGTPEGVGEIKDGDILYAELSGYVNLLCKVSKRK